MLKYSINTKNLKEKYTTLDINSIVEDRDMLNINATVEDSAALLKNGEKVAFTRYEDSDINFYEEKLIQAEEHDSASTTFKVTTFPYMDYKVNGVYSGSTSKFPGSNIQYSFLKFYTDDENLHYLYENRDKEIKEHIDEGYDPTKSDFGKKRCVGDMVIYNRLFLFKSTGVNEANRYVFGETFENKKDSLIVIYGDDEVEAYFSDKIKYGTNWKYEDKKLYLKNCITPSLYSGKDNRNLLLWEISNNDVAQLLIDRQATLLYKVRDDRFLKLIGENNEYELRGAAKIKKVENTINIFNVVQENISTNLIQEELLEEYAENIKEEYKNKIIDYEKQVFEPVSFYDSEYANIEELDFILNFRKREPATGVTDIYGNLLYLDYGEWKTNDNLYWNNYNYNRTINRLTATTEYSYSGDLLGYLGFSDDDVYYRKNKISKSFIRLSIYDKKSRGSQKLLHTSTIFLDENKLYSNYINNIKRSVEVSVSGYTYKEETPYRIESVVKCRGKYNNDISNGYGEKSSEGFYMYLFPNLLTEIDYSGNPYAEVYMKVEFNHAKYGYTIPFVRPIDEEGNVISPTAKKFPISYIDKDTNGKSYANMERLYNDMYIPIIVKYDIINNRYIWGVNGKRGDNKLKFKLFEPKINREENA